MKQAPVDLTGQKRTFHLNKYESSLPKYLVEIGQFVLEKRILKYSMYFNYFVIISPW